MSQQDLCQTEVSGQPCSAFWESHSNKHNKSRTCLISFNAQHASLGDVCKFPSSTHPAGKLSSFLWGNNILLMSGQICFERFLHITHTLLILFFYHNTVNYFFNISEHSSAMCDWKQQRTGKFFLNASFSYRFTTQIQVIRQLQQ